MMYSGRKVDDEIGTDLYISKLNANAASILHLQKVQQVHLATNYSIVGQPIPKH